MLDLSPDSKTGLTDVAFRRDGKQPLLDDWLKIRQRGRDKIKLHVLKSTTDTDVDDVSFVVCLSVKRSWFPVLVVTENY